MRAFLVVLLLPTLAYAQPADVAGTRARSTREIDCLQRQLSELRTTIQLLREAQSQLSSSHADLRDAAVHTVVSLEQRAARISEAVKACVPENAGLPAQTRVREPTGVDARVEQENAATQVVERDARLASYVQIVVGERVDGHGTVAATDVRRMVRGVGSRIERCYGQYVERNALETGTAILSFTVTTSGRIRGVRVEQAMGDRTFQRCLRRAGQGIRARASAMGGDAQFSYTLRFGPGT